MTARVEAGLIRKTLLALGDPAVAFVLWDGTEVAPGERAPVAKIGIADRTVLMRLLADPQLQFGELYMAGKIAIEGDLTALLAEIYRCTSRFPAAARAIAQWAAKTRNTPLTARRNARRHYDLGNEFYALWLDETLTYSCAYFATPAMTLGQAQIAKMNHIARKLRLQAGQRVVEIGSGWGGLALHLARHFDVTVTAFNVSKEQLAYSRQRAAEAGLSDKVEFVEQDYRDIPRLGGSYDALVSVGMLEHVGVRHYREFGEVLRQCLRPSGYALIQSIGRIKPAPVNPWIARRIFPGGYVPALKEMLEIFEAADCAVLDVENLRLHYARTLEYWRERFEGERERVVRMFDEAFVRMWRLYLAGSAAAFRSGDMQLFQVLCAPRENHGVPQTRAHLYS